MATEEEEYFAAYLTIQTSDVTKNQLDFVKKLTKFVKKQGGVMYTAIQSGKPPVPPPCPPAGCA